MPSFPPIFDWASGRLTIATVPLWLWVLAAAIERLRRGRRNTRPARFPHVWLWTLVIAVAWAALATATPLWTWLSG
jgi:hypothetical protein